MAKPKPSRKMAAKKAAAPANKEQRAAKSWRGPAIRLGAQKLMEGQALSMSHNLNHSVDEESPET